MSNLYLNNEEQITFSLRWLYEAYGYSRYEMSKFEEYDLYPFDYKERPRQSGRSKGLLRRKGLPRFQGNILL